MNRIEFGDCREIMERWIFDDVKVQTCVTSPPYFGLRDYGVAGQLGLESTPDEYIRKMVRVFQDVRDLLTDDGTLWLNIGDSYSNDGKWGGSSGGKHVKELHGNTGIGRGKKNTGLKTKDLIGIPWMLAFALRADGWYLRQDIIWHKPNPMPESVTDRCTKAHEYIFLLSKSPKYYFDNEAIKTPCSPKTATVKTTPRKGSGVESTGEKVNAWMEENGGRYIPEKANKRSVWSVSSRPYKGAHFACFPPELIEPCILAGTSEGGHCSKCGTRQVRQLEKTAMVIDRSDRTHELGRTRTSGTMVSPATSKTTGWVPGCKCGVGFEPDIVLDPFMGSGTTAAVALKYDRQYLGCELNNDYKKLQDERIAKLVDLKKAG